MKFSCELSMPAHQYDSLKEHIFTDFVISVQLIWLINFDPTAS
jgi:hypothetical protein